MKAISQLLPDKTPRYGGKIKFPAPKTLQIVQIQLQLHL